MNRASRKVRVPDLAVMKERSDRIVMLTAYDATIAPLLDRAGIDLLLVGGSLGNVIWNWTQRSPYPWMQFFTTHAP